MWHERARNVCQSKKKLTRTHGHVVTKRARKFCCASYCAALCVGLLWCSVSRRILLIVVATAVQFTRQCQSPSGRHCGRIPAVAWKDHPKVATRDRFALCCRFQVPCVFSIMLLCCFVLRRTVVYCVSCCSVLRRIVDIVVATVVQFSTHHCCSVQHA
jgi:hypothetical protein